MRCRNCDNVPEVAVLMADREPVRITLIFDADLAEEYGIVPQEYIAVRTPWTQPYPYPRFVAMLRKAPVTFKLTSR